MGDQVKLQVHRVRFFEHQPQTINCISVDELTSRVAISRSDASVEIYNLSNNWYQEMVFPGLAGGSVEALLWVKGRLFATGLGGNVVELDLNTVTDKISVSSNAGAVWCMTTNAAQDRIAAGTEDGCVVLFDVSDELEFMRCFGKQEGRILCITWFSYENENVIITGGINNIRQWSIKSGQPISRMTLGRQFNKDTIVWCIGVTKEFTIVSGDSRGVVTFWNGKESTQLKTFHCHKADVLSLCLSKDGQVFTGGVDANLFKFSLCAIDAGSERKRWVQQTLRSRHTHDIRALAHTKNKVVSGGVDTYINVTMINAMGQVQEVREVAPFPSVGLVSIAEEKNLIQLQYPQYIEVWRLGTAATPFSELRGILPLTSKPIKLVQLCAREGQHILCSALASSGTLAFSDSSGVRLYNLEITDKDQSTQPEVALKRQKVKVTGPARQMTFTPNGQSLVILPFGSSSVQVLDVNTGSTQHCLQPSGGLVHRLCISPDSQHLAVSSLDHSVHVYSLSSGQHVCSCPVLKSQVSAMAFSLHSPALVLAYCDQKVYEFDTEKREFTPWSRDSSEQFPHHWLKKLNTIKHISFQPSQPDHIVFHTAKALCVLDKTKPMKAKESSSKSDNAGRQALKPESVRVCLNYRFLMYADFLSNGMMVAVERPPSTIAEALPPSFKRKRFGVS